jgi:hypothetical protein
MNPFREVNWRPNLAARRQFARSLVIGFPCVALLMLVAHRVQGGAWSLGFPLALAAGGVAAGLVLWALPQIALPFYVVWYGAACCIGLVVGNVVLAAVYLLMFAPFGWARRALGRGEFSKGFDRTATTYWRDAELPEDAARYYRQY